MNPGAEQTIINLTAVIVAVTDEQPRVLIVDQDGAGLPNGPFDPAQHDSLESGLRQWVEAQTGLDLYYVEQLYTFGNRNRDPIEIMGGPRVVSVAYMALTHEDKVDTESAEWRDWYSFLPWEDWRPGRPALLDETIRPALDRWTRQSKNEARRRQRQDRVHVTFGPEAATQMDAVLSLERYELLYEADLVAEALRDHRTDLEVPFGMGEHLVSDRSAARQTGLSPGRLRVAARRIHSAATAARRGSAERRQATQAKFSSTGHKRGPRRTDWPNGAHWQRPTRRVVPLPARSAGRNPDRRTVAPDHARRGNLS
jgi:hypothetical protein